MTDSNSKIYNSFRKKDESNKPLSDNENFDDVQKVIQ